MQVIFQVGVNPDGSLGAQSSVPPQYLDHFLAMLERVKFKMLTAMEKPEGPKIAVAQMVPTLNGIKAG